MKNMKGIIVSLSAFIIAALALAVFAVYSFFGTQGFHFDIKSITAYESIDNENLVRFEIKGTVKKWIFDKNEYNNVYLQGEECGGEIRYFNTAAQSDVINISHKKSEFTIKFDIDKTSYNWGDPVEEYIFQERFWLLDAENDEINYDLSYILDMYNYSDNIKVEWQDPKKIDDSLLEIENWREYMETQGDEDYLTDYPY